MDTFLDTPYFGLALTLVTYAFAYVFCQKVKKPFVNPMLLSTASIIAVLVIFDIPYTTYFKGSAYIALFVGPATASIGLSIYRQYEVLKKNFWPIMIGCFIGSISSMVSAVLLCKLFKLDDVMIATMFPKSVTSPIAMEISSIGKGLSSVTVGVVIFSGIVGAVTSPVLIKMLRLKNKVAIGIAMGTSSHAMGTTRATEMGDVEGAMSGLAMGISGIITVIVALFIYSSG